jgi:hypothetical protein
MWRDGEGEDARRNSRRSLEVLKVVVVVAVLFSVITCRY